MQPVVYLGKTVAGKSRGSTEISLPSVMKQKVQIIYRAAKKRIQKAVKKSNEDWIGTQCEEVKTCLNKNNNKRAYKLVMDLTFLPQRNRVDLQLFRTGLGKNKRFSADGQNNAQNYTAIRVVVTMQFWTAVSPKRKTYNGSCVRKLRLQ